MASSIKIRTQRLDGYTEVKLLINHPMENGRNRDPGSGELIPAHYIQELRLALNGKVLITADMAGSVAKNPFFTFRLKSARAGDRIDVDWIDNRNLGDSAGHIIE